MGYFSQDIIISNLNEEFKKQNLPSQIQLDEGGVCNGLSLVYMLYALQGQEKEFFEILDLVSRGKINLEKENGLHGSILFFAHQVLMTAEPYRYDQSKSQAKGMGLLKINQKHLKSSFDFALATSDKHWSSIIAELDIQDNEAMVVRSTDHTIIVRKVNNQYRVYDPNYIVKFKDFANENDLIKELHNPVFGYKKGNLGLEINLVRHPDAQDNPRTPPFPDRKELYANYLSPENATATSGDRTFNTFTKATAMLEDSETIKYLINQCKPELPQWHEAAFRAVIEDNDKFLQILLTQLKEEEQLLPLIEKLINRAAIQGKMKIFDLLEPYFSTCYANVKPDHLIIFAAAGGNPEIMKKVLSMMPNLLDTYWESCKTFMSLEKAIPKCIKEAVFTGLSKATSRGNTECITLLLDELNKLNAPLNEKQRLELLQEAICHNQLYALLLLIKSDPAVSKKIMPLITLSATAVQNTDLIIIKELREQGVSFTPSAEELILAKTQNIYLSFITLLTLVLDHIQLFLGKKTAISYNKSSLLEMKKA